MGAIHKAKQMMKRSGCTYFAALYLKHMGYSLEATLHNLLGAKVRK